MNNSIKLPDFLSHLEVVGTLKEELELCRAPLNVQIDDPNFTVENYGSPAMAMPPSMPSEMSAMVVPCGRAISLRMEISTRKALSRVKS